VRHCIAQAGANLKTVFINNSLYSLYMTLGGNILARRRLNKLVSVFLLAFQTIFLNFIVPGHTRGVVTLSGKNSLASIADTGCPFCRPVKTDPKKAPSREDQSDCVICNLAIRLTIAPTIDFKLDELGLLEMVPPPRSDPAPICIAIPVHYCRGPPAISV
jgi:hypothetical protein